MMTPRQKAEQVAYAMGLPVYLHADGRITQHGPGERIEPPKGAVPIDDSGYKPGEPAKSG